MCENGPNNFFLGICANLVPDLGVIIFDMQYHITMGNSSKALFFDFGQQRIFFHIFVHNDSFYV